MKSEEIAGILQERFGASILEVKLDTLLPWAKVTPQRIADIGRFLRDDPQTRFDYLRCVAAVDYPPEFELVYLLFSYPKRHEFQLKVRVPRENPVVPTVEEVWPAANWHEREAFDLMGIRFEGHSDLRRIMLPDDWIGHPLRKDYKEQEEYQGIGTRREYLTGMPPLPTSPAK